VRPRWRNARAVTVNRFTVCAEIRHFVMAITLVDACDDFANNYANRLTRLLRRAPGPHRGPVSVRLRPLLFLPVALAAPDSIKSDWVEDEVTIAFEEERKRGQPMLFPIRLDDTVMPTDEAWAEKLRARNIGDFRNWKDHKYMNSLERVLRDLSVSVP
jgi:hypothetical protein